MSTDASQCWRITPFLKFEAGEEWWVLGPDHQPVPGGIVPNKEEAFAIALDHNRAYGVNAVFVHDWAMKNGKWEKPLDLSQCWTILPVPYEGKEAYWCVLGPGSDNPETVPSRQLTREEAFVIALKHNNEHGVNAVYIHGIAMKKGKWEEAPADAQLKGWAPFDPPCVRVKCDGA